MRHTSRQPQRPGLTARGVLLLPALLLGLVAFPAAAAEPVPEVDEDVRKAELELEIIRLLLKRAEKENIELGDGLDDVTRLDAVRRRIQAPDDDLLPARDPWGNSYLLIIGPQLLLVSAGPDGALDLSYESEERRARLLLRDLVDDIVADSHAVFSGRRRDQWLQTQTMADIRSIGTSIEAFAVDSNVYPGPTGGFVVVDWAAPDLSPTFIRELPSKDGWGEPIYFWSDGTDYFLVSFGSDGVPDQPYHSMLRPPEELSGAGKTADPAQDIIYHVGGFVQWPERVNHR